MTEDSNNQSVVDLRDSSFQDLFSAALLCFGVVGCLALSVRLADARYTLREQIRASAPLIVLGAALALVAALRRCGRARAAGWLFILGLLAAPTIDLAIHGPGTGAFLVYTLPIAMAGVIIGQAEFYVAALATALAVAGTAASAPRLDLFGIRDVVAATAAPVGVYWLLALITALNARLVGATVQWATDSQQKEARRADLFYRQQQELDRALLDLRLAHGRLQQANVELDAARRAAEAANLLKTRFLTDVNHELRAPLNAIVSFVRMLGKPRYGELNERQGDLQERILANAGHLLGLINDLLDLAKIESGRVDLRYEQIDLALLLKGVMATTVGLTRSKGLALKLDIPDPLPPVWVDKTRIRQVLLNLLSNAAKFTDAGSIAVRVSSEFRVQSSEFRVQSSELPGAAETHNSEIGRQSYITIAVTDTGIGIAPEYQAQVFEEFRQVEFSVERRSQGTGLGLPISRRLVELHGGRIWLESAPGRGSTFAFTIPVEPPARVADGPEPERAMPLPAADTGATLPGAEDDAA